MKIAIWAAIAFGIVLVGIVAAATLLPETRRGSAAIEIAAPPDRIVAVIEDVETQVAWRPQLARVERTALGWTEETRSGEIIRFSWLERSPSLLSLAFQSSAGYSGRWVAELVATPSGTKVSVLEEAKVPHPLNRLVARLFFDPQKFAADYLAALKSQAERH